MPPLPDNPANDSLQIPPRPWSRLRQFTPARIALGRSGGSQLTPHLLDFRLSHARARDAVQAPFHPETLQEVLAASGHESIFLQSRVDSRRQYLLRPDLGRRLSEASACLLEASSPAWGPRDLAVIISDGLAAQAAENHAVATVLLLLENLTALGWSIYPVFVVPLARVKIQDEIGGLLGAKITLMLLGERPGLGTPDSLGAYFTYGPGAHRTDADRNCLSNIRPEGLPPAQAARKLATLLVRAAQEKMSGVALKDEDEFLALPTDPNVSRPVLPDQ